MRFYNISITPVSGGMARTWTTVVNGQTDPGAQLVELDIFSVPFDTATINSYIRIWGVSIQDISQASDFNGQNITVSGGMSPGLPLATQQAPHAGVLAKGQVWQALGNWVNENMTLDLFINPIAATANSPKLTSPNPPPANLTVQWKAGTPLKTAIANTLKTAYPNIQQNIAISANLVLPNDETGAYMTLAAFSEYVRMISLKILNPMGTGTYPGVSVAISANGTFNVTDSTMATGSGATGPIQLQFNDLIGQPTWIDPGTVQVTSVMRSDIHVGGTIKLPTADQAAAAGTVTVLPNALSQFRQKSIFQGSFYVTKVHHVGNSRQPDAEAWITVIDATPTSTQ